MTAEQTPAPRRSADQPAPHDRGPLPGEAHEPGPETGGAHAYPGSGEGRPAQDRPAQDGPAQDRPGRNGPVQNPPAQTGRGQNLPAQGVPAPRRSRSTDLDLNGGVPPRATPLLGEWGPDGVPSTLDKQRQRRIAAIVFGVAVLVVAVAWHYFWVRLG